MTHGGRSRQHQQNMVIVSIKPERPQYPVQQKVVAVVQALEDWDKLDAYYRGQILNYKTKAKAKGEDIKSEGRGEVSTRTFKVTENNENVYAAHAIPSSKDCKNSNKTKSEYGHNKKHKDSKSKSKKLRDDLFLIDPKEPFFHLPLAQPQNNKSEEPDLKSQQQQDGKKLFKQEKKKNEEDNYLAVPREDLKIKLHQKNRILCQSQIGHQPRLLVPLQVAAYTPPVTGQGLNSVHIQKILYHKSPTVPSPTTTSTSTGGSPGSVAVTVPISCNQVLSHSSNSSSSASHHPINSNIHSPVVCKDKISNSSLPMKYHDQMRPNDRVPCTKLKGSPHYPASGLTDVYIPPPPTKRPIMPQKPVHSDKVEVEPSNKRKVATDYPKTGDRHNKTDLSPSSFPSSTTDLFGEPAPKKARKSSSGRSTPKTPTTPTTPSPSEFSKSSVIDLILNESKRTLAPSNQKEMEERQKRRLFESEMRKSFAAKKDQEFYEKEALEWSMKSFEFIMEPSSLLSPISSPFS